MPDERNSLSWSAQPPLVASWRAKSLPLPSGRHTSGSFYLPSASAPGSFDIPASLCFSPDTSSGPPAHLRALRAHFLLIDPDLSGLVPMPLLPRCLVAAGVHLPPGPLAKASSLVARSGRMCDWRALLRWLKANPELISPSLTSAPALVHPGVLTDGSTGSAEAAEAAVAAVSPFASGLRPSSSAPTLPLVVPHRATAAELKARIKLPFASPAALQWAASGAAGVGGQPGVAAGAAAAAVRRVGGASAAQIYPKLPCRDGGTPTSTARPPAHKSTRHSRRNLAQVIQRRLNESDPGAHAREAHTLARPPAPKSSQSTYVAVVTPCIHEPVNLLGSARLCARPDHQVAVCDYGESYRSVSPRRSSFTSSLPSLADYLPEQARRGPRSVSALRGLTLHPSLLSVPQRPLPPSPSACSPVRCPAPLDPPE